MGNERNEESREVNGRMKGMKHVMNEKRMKEGMNKNWEWERK